MRAHVLNLSGLGAAIFLAVWLNLAASPDSIERQLTSVGPTSDTGQPPPLVDADGILFSPCDYRRVVSLNPVADHLLVQLLEPERLVGYSAVTANGHPEIWRFGAKPHIARGASLEEIFSLRPDLVIASPFVDASKATRLREEGIDVFNLGEMRGLATVRPNIQSLGRLLNVEQRAKGLGERLDREIRGLQNSVPKLRPRGLYLSVYGDAFFGGTAGTSYADVLRLGGITDVAAAAGLVDWPQYASEQILSLQPDVLVTRRGMAGAIRAHPVLGQLDAARDPHGILEIDPAYDGDAGLGVLRAAASLQESIRKRTNHD